MKKKIIYIFSIQEDHLPGLFWIQYEDLIKYFTTKKTGHE